MTEAARRVLDSCRGAVDDLPDGIQGDAWRRRWITAVVLLRAVGHVLKNVDSDQDHAYRDAIDAAWDSITTSKPNPLIFWGFIEDERNNILKENLTVAGQGVTVHLGAKPWSEHHYLINSGPFNGREQRDLLREAIAWWEGYLDQIDADAEAHRRS